MTVTLLFLHVQCLPKGAGKASYQESDGEAVLARAGRTLSTKHPLLASPSLDLTEPSLPPRVFTKGAATWPRDTVPPPPPQNDLSSSYYSLSPQPDSIIHLSSCVLPLSWICHFCFEYFYLIIPGLHDQTVSFLTANNHVLFHQSLPHWVKHCAWYSEDAWQKCVVDGVIDPPAPTHHCKTRQ